MKRTTTLLLLSATTYFAHAQCTDISIPNTAIVVNTSGTTDPPPGAVWVCGGVDVTIMGDYHELYIESGSTVQVVGNFCVGFMKGPGTLNSIGDTCIWSIEPTVTFMPSGSFNIGSPCTPVTYDYTSAPTPGCAGVTGVDEVVAPGTLQVMPNPASTMFTVNTNDGLAWSHELLDASGRVLQRLSARTGLTTFDVSTLAPGRYILRSWNASTAHTTAVLVVR